MVFGVVFTIGTVCWGFVMPIIGRQATLLIGVPDDRGGPALDAAVTTAVSDARFLQQEFVTSSHFKKEADGSKWTPSPCRSS